MECEDEKFEIRSALKRFHSNDKNNHLIMPLLLLFAVMLEKQGISSEDRQMEKYVFHHESTFALR